MKILLVLIFLGAVLFGYQEQKHASAVQSELDTVKQQLDQTQTKLTAAENELTSARQQLAAMRPPPAQAAANGGVSAGQSQQGAPPSKPSGDWMWSQTGMDAPSLQSKSKRH